MYDLIIIGGGPAGLTAGLYSARARLNVLMLEKLAPGGQVMNTDWVENYPGFPDGISGFELVDRMKNQAEKFGLKIQSDEVAGLELSGDQKIVTTHKEKFETKSLIIATGATWKKLGIEGEESLAGKGISYCATCDGEFFTGKEVVVVGGGNSALEEAVALTSYATRVTIVHQFDHFQAFKHAIEQAEKNPRISFIMESELRSFKGNGVLKEVTMEHLPTGKTIAMNTDGVFIFAGYIPNTAELEGLVELNERKEIVVDTDLKTNIPGVFAAGDCIVKKYRQVTTAVADGTIASLSAAEYLRS